jgi:hypothetical protein
MRRPSHDLIDNSVEFTIDDYKVHLGTLTVGDAFVIVKHTHADAITYTIVKTDRARIKDVYRDITFNKQL